MMGCGVMGCGGEVVRMALRSGRMCCGEKVDWRGWDVCFEANWKERWRGSEGQWGDGAGRLTACVD